MKIGQMGSRRQSPEKKQLIMLPGSTQQTEDSNTLTFVDRVDTKEDQTLKVLKTNPDNVTDSQILEKQSTQAKDFDDQMRYAAMHLNAGQHYSSLDSQSQEEGVSIESGRTRDNAILPSQYDGKLHAYASNLLNRSPDQPTKEQKSAVYTCSPGEDLKNVYTFRPFIVQSIASPQLSYFNKSKKSFEKR